MQASSEESERALPDFSLGSDFAEVAANFSDEFARKMRVNDFDETPAFLEEDEYEYEDEVEFSFASVGTIESTSSADDMFQNGQIKPVFPLFDQSLLFAEDSLPPAVKKVFVEARDSSPPATAEDGEAAGPYCEWSRKAVEVSPELNKKSNSTGFSKFWRFREPGTRSNSNGRDAFVFLNGASTTSRISKREEKSEAIPEKRSVGEAKAVGGSTAVKTAAAGKKVAGKGKTTPSSAHEKHYVRSRASREEVRRRSYLPYRPGVVGFFTNVQGGLTRDVHPF
ncbi:uncharacterized protein LOC127796384 [Diospyros lotus]|uniref:uncharacterized protein LOC127796384 n=1 Tax=Diospyros lotus TaxID=55363 RepID=UPI00224FC986|nr:uncharacterized protein LOC127796384 [Diospyros lotus]